MTVQVRAHRPTIMYGENKRPERDYTFADNAVSRRKSKWQKFIDVMACWFEYCVHWSVSVSHSPFLRKFVLCWLFTVWMNKWMRINFHTPHSLSGIYEIAFTHYSDEFENCIALYCGTNDEIESSLCWVGLNWVVVLLLLQLFCGMCSVFILHTNFKCPSISYILCSTTFAHW